MIFIIESFENRTIDKTYTRVFEIIMPLRLSKLLRWVVYQFEIVTFAAFVAIRLGLQLRSPMPLFR
jgi:hypothetical protein